MMKLDELYYSGTFRGRDTTMEQNDDSVVPWILNFRDVSRATYNYLSTNTVIELGRGGEGEEVLGLARGVGIKKVGNDCCRTRLK